jgi:demethylmenaquinone methyltransferase/2-methoxy-6-polyprenyl-1,4-benzoquinol methylase
VPAPDIRDPAAVREMFGRIAPGYDLANHLLSGGLDFRWRARAARIVADWRPSRVLDAACGSGDLALAIQRRITAAEVIASDFAPEMLEIARAKGVRKTVLADAMALPFPDETFDTVTVAFGLRNMQDWKAALGEMRRVLRGGGHLLVLDFSLPAGLMRPPYRFYLHRVLPLVAGAVTGQPDAYHYLGSSIEEFPSGSSMLHLLADASFSQAAAQPLTFGIATIYTAVRGT